MKNICIGLNAGSCITTGHHNILIGENEGIEITTESFVFSICGLYHSMKDENEYFSWRPHKKSGSLERLGKELKSVRDLAII